MNRVESIDIQVREDGFDLLLNGEGRLHRLRPVKEDGVSPVEALLIFADFVLGVSPIMDGPIEPFRKPGYEGVWLRLSVRRIRPPIWELLPVEIAN